ncbi:MAG: hypothetical protein ACYC6T_09495 [Thermoleophilia bacterium]
MSVGWLSVVLFPLLAGFFACTLLAALERSWRFAAVAAVSLVAAGAAVLLTGHAVLPLG